MRIAPSLIVGAASLVFVNACSRSADAVPTAPSAVLSAAAELTDTLLIEPLPLGASSASEASCPAGSVAGTLCRRVFTACATVPAASALLRITPGRADAPRRGTIVLTTGGAGTTLNGAIPLGQSMIQPLVADGVTVVELAWDQPGIWGGPQPRTLACRYATAARWIYDNVHHGDDTLFAAQGTSGGAAQIAFALAYYGLDDIIGLANLGSGPPGCPLCSPDGIHPPEPLLPAAPPALNREPKLAFPRTEVNMFLGEREPTQTIIADANAFFDAILPAAKSMTIVPGTPHDIESTQAGVDAYVRSVRQALNAPRVMS